MPPKYPQSSYRSPFPQPKLGYDDYNTNSPNNPRRWSEGVDLPRPDFNHHGYSEPPPLPPRPQSHFYDEDYYPTEPSSYPKHSPEVWKFPEPSIPQPFAFETRPQLQVSSYHESPRPRYDSLYEDRTPVDNYHSEYSSSAYHSQTESRQSSSERLPNTPPNRNSDVFNDELSRLALDVDCIQKFQEGELPEQDEEWHKLVPAAAKDALPKKEVQRQSTIFEVIKSEKDYVLDLQLINEVYIQKLLASSPAVITPRAELEKFVEEVFNNVMEIEKIHEQMVRTLFVRQRQQHPIIDTISDIILDASFSFQSQYEKYIKHYPFAEGRHRRELKSNPLYRDFIDKCNQDTRTRKRDLITLISRPVTRLPRLSLILEHVQKLSPPEHVDVETIPIILGILQQFVKSTQPGIAAAEGKVKFWNYVDSLQFERGEIIDLDPGNETRNLLHTGAVSRLRSRNWEDIDATLLDHYFIMTRPLMKSGMKQNVVASRPIPLDFLQLGTFNLPIEYRKESPNTELEGGSSGGILSALKRDVKVPVYPFVVFHASLHTLRRYTLAVKSEEARKKWQDQLIDALATRKAQQESNKFFAVQQLSGEFFRVKTVLVPADSSLRRKQDYFTGKVSCAGRFNSGGRHFLAVGCSLGIFIGYQSQSSSFVKAVALPGVTSLAIIEPARQLVALSNGNLFAYPLDELAVSVRSKAPIPSSSMTRLDGRSGTVTFMIVGQLADKPVLCYGVKTFRETTVYVMEIYAKKASVPAPSSKSAGIAWLKPYGTPFYVPRDCTGVTLLKNMVALATDHSIAVINPAIPSAERKSVSVPDFINLDPQSIALKSRCQANIPIGIVRASQDELMVLFDTFGCYVTKHGVPARNSQFVRWETKISSFVSRHPHVLLFSENWIEVRHAPSGRFVEVIEGKDIKHLQIAQPNAGALLVTMKGETDNETGMAEKLTELVETRPLGESSTAADSQWTEWNEWDM